MEPLKPSPDEQGETEARGANSPARDPLLGKLVSDKYRILDLITQGGMGRVYRAEQLPLGRVCAVKVLRPKAAFDASDAAVQKRFLLEAATCARLTHANTVTLYDYGQLNIGNQITFFMVMELVQGRTLADALRMDGPFAPRRALSVAREICRSLHEAHQLGIVHRDLKPSNVMLVKTDEGERVKVLDFGIARVLEDGQPDYTQEDSVVGSPRFMSPEQIRHHDLDGRADLYSLGVLLYLMLTGQVPFAKDAVMGTLMAHLTEPVPGMKEQTGVDVPPAVETIVRRCLEKNPRDRYPNAQALRETLEETLATIEREEDEALAAADAAARANLATQPITRPFPRPTAVAPTAVAETPEPAPAFAPPKSKLPAIVVALVLLVLALIAMLATRGPDVTGDAATPTTPGPAAPVAPPTTALTLQSAPPGAAVWDGETQVGTTPLTIQIEGTALHRYNLKMTGYKSAILEFTPAGTAETRDVALEKEVAKPSSGRNGRTSPPPPNQTPPATRRNDLDIMTER